MSFNILRACLFEYPVMFETSLVFIQIRFSILFMTQKIKFFNKLAVFVVFVVILILLSENWIFKKCASICQLILKRCLSNYLHYTSAKLHILYTLHIHYVCFIYGVSMLYVPIIFLVKTA